MKSRVYLATEFHVYSLPPMDYGWSASRSANGWINDLALDTDESEYLGPRQVSFLLSIVLGDLNGEKIRIDPKVLVFPSADPQPKIGFLLKLDDNGTTMCYSPYKLPWLAGFYSESLTLPATIPDSYFGMGHALAQVEEIAKANYGGRWAVQKFTTHYKGHYGASPSPDACEFFSQLKAFDDLEELLYSMAEFPASHASVS
jgi:hypothetical protein